MRVYIHTYICIYACVHGWHLYTNFNRMIKEHKEGTSKQTGPVYPLTQLWDWVVSELQIFISCVFARTVFAFMRYAYAAIKRRHLPLLFEFFLST